MRGMPIWTTQYTPWPGSNIPRHQWPRGMHLDEAGNPKYPPGVTCKQLGEENPYIPFAAWFWVIIAIAFVLYIVWPLKIWWMYVRTSMEDSFERADGPFANFEDAHEDFVSGRNKRIRGDRESGIDS